MPQDQKKPEPLAEETILDSVKGMGKQAFRIASEEAEKSIEESFRRMQLVKEMVTDGYQIVEHTVGRDRLLGAALGAKAGALLLAKPGPLFFHGVATGAILGAGAGLVLGKTFFEKWRKVNGNDNDSAPPPLKPQDPAP